MGALGRQRAAVVAGIRSTLREPTTVVLLLALPPLVVAVFDAALATYGAAPGIEVGPTEAERGGALFSTAFLAGLLGVFQIVSAAEADGRLVVCGYRPAEVVGARLVAIGLASLLVTAITYATFATLTPESIAAPGLAVLALLLAAATYALVGVIVGAVIGRELEGSLLLVFVADFDSFTSLGVIPTESVVLEYTPLERPARMLTDAVTAGTIDAVDLVGAIGYLLALLAVAIAIVEFRGDVA
jgi:ABC-2 type transport system permease protein